MEAAKSQLLAWLPGMESDNKGEVALVLVLGSGLTLLVGYNLVTGLVGWWARAEIAKKRVARQKQVRAAFQELDRSLQGQVCIHVLSEP